MEARLEPVLMQLGDVMIRDVRGLHRGTPNRAGTSRPMVVIGYSRRWLFRPEVSIQIPKAADAGCAHGSSAFVSGSTHTWPISPAHPELPAMTRPPRPAAPPTPI